MIVSCVCVRVTWQEAEPTTITILHYYMWSGANSWTIKSFCLIFAWSILFYFIFTLPIKLSFGRENKKKKTRNFFFDSNCLFMDMAVCLFAAIFFSFWLMIYNQRFHNGTIQNESVRANEWMSEWERERVCVFQNEEASQRVGERVHMCFDIATYVCFVPIFVVLLVVLVSIVVVSSRAHFAK